MADYFPGVIHIGGPIRVGLLERLIETIVAEGVSLDNYGGRTVTEEELRKAFHADDVVRLYDDQASYGQFDELEEFLVRHRIHFDRHSDGRYEFDPENVYYRGGKVVVMPATESGQPLLHCDEVLRILQSRRLTADRKLVAIWLLVAPPETAPLAPVQLVSRTGQKGEAQPCPKPKDSTSPS